MSLELFPKDKTVGIFSGFTEGGLEFKADLILPYKNNFQTIPMHGQFLLVQLENPDEAVLGRITSLSSEGKLSFGSGEEFNIRALQDGREVPDDLRKEYLRYRINIRVLGVVRKKDNKIEFAPSHRRLPHVGSPVAFPSDEVLKEIVGHNIEDAATIGHFALGEFVYCGTCEATEVEDWMQICQPEIKINFPISNLVSRRSFIFARAGFGKSNLNKLLFSELYKETPTVEKHNKKVPVGTVIFDPDGEYFWPDDKGRPGLCDVPHLKDKLVVFTQRKGPSPFYQSFVAGGIKLDIRRMRPSDVIAIALSPDKQDQQNVRKLKGLSSSNWERLVDLIDKNGNIAPLDEIKVLMNLDEERQEAEAVAARSNMTQITRMLHDKSSQLMDMLLDSLSQGKLCIIDVSQMRGNQALVLSGLILRRIFDKNQEEFTNAEPKTIPTIAVVEEAQSVLNEKSSGATPYIEWVKEGRKYDLGALLITQQPGSIPVEILSQGDNWFIFHLLSASDLGAAKSANAHFSQDILSSLLNEPIPGQGIFWSSVKGKPYPTPLRIISFNKLFSPIDKEYKRAEENTFAKKLRDKFLSTPQVKTAGPSFDNTVGLIDTSLPPEADTADNLRSIEAIVIDTLKENKDFNQKVKSNNGIAWGTVKALVEKALPDTVVDGRGERAYELVLVVMNELHGQQNIGWHAFKNAESKTYIKLGAKP